MFEPVAGDGELVICRATGRELRRYGIHVSGGARGRKRTIGQNIGILDAGSLGTWLLGAGLLRRAFAGRWRHSVLLFQLLRLGLGHRIGTLTDCNSNAPDDRESK